MPQLQELVSPENKQILEDFLKPVDYHFDQLHEATMADKDKIPTDIYADAHPNIAHEYADVVDDPSAPFTFPESKEPLLEASNESRAQDGNWLDQLYTERANANAEQGASLDVQPPTDEEQTSQSTGVTPGFREIRVPPYDVIRSKPLHASNIHEEEAEPEHREIISAESRLKTLLSSALTAVEHRAAMATEGKSPSADDVTEFFTQFEQFKNEGMDPQSLEMIQELFTKAYDAAPLQSPEAPQHEEAAPLTLEAPVEFVRPGSAEFRTISTESVKIEPSVALVEAPEKPAELEVNEPKLDRLKGFWNRSREWVKDPFRPSETVEKWKGALLNPYYKLAADASTWVAMRRSNYEIKMATMDEREREMKLAKGRLAFTAGVMVFAAYKIYQINQGLDSGHVGMFDAMDAHTHVADALGAGPSGHAAGLSGEHAVPLDAPSYTPAPDVKIEVLPGTTHVDVTEVTGSGSGTSAAHETVPSNATMHPHGLEALAPQESFSVKSIQPNEGGVDWFKRMGLSAKQWYNHVPEMDKLFGGKELRMSGTDLRLNHEGMVSKSFQEYIKKLKEQG